MGTTNNSAKAERINVRVDRATKQKLEKKAAAAKRTPSDFVRLLIERAVA